MDKNEIRKEMELEQQRTNCKQCCTKIDQSLGKFDLRSGERAIWELIQNARDVAKGNSDSDKKAYIKITLTPSEFVFAHRGCPFTTETLRALVMQVSSESKEDDDTVGQYGTGFVTTHKFGRKVHVTGSLDMGKFIPGTYADINRFEIDRTYQDMTEFIDKVAKQIIAVNDYADANLTTTCREWTKLSYDLSSAEGASEAASDAITAAIAVMPYVMTINKRIVSVELENQLTGDVYQFEKAQLPDEAGLKVMAVTFTHNGVVKEEKIYYLESEDGEDIAILPLSSPTTAKSLAGIPKLFVFFPLLGTEDFGIDAVFHSKRFYPVEERNGLHLPESNTNNRLKYEQNVRVLDSMSKMVQNYYRLHADEITGWMDVAALSIDCEHHKENITRDYFCKLKESWSSFYRSLPIVDLHGSRVSVAGSNVRFFAPSIVEDIENEAEGEHRFDAIYNTAKLFYPIVSRNKIVSWSKVVASWGNSDASLIEVNDIAKSVAASEDVPMETLFAFDAYLKDKDLLSLFAKYTLIPNRDGKKKSMSELRDARSIPIWLGEFSKMLAAEKVETFADDSFAHLVKLTSFSRNELRDAITNSLKRLRQQYLDRGIVYEDSIRENLLKLSSIFATETASMVRRNAIGIIAEHMGQEVSVRNLPPIDSNEPDIAELPFKHLVECMLIEISQSDSTWVNNNLDYVEALHLSLSPWAEYYNRNTKEGLCTKYGAFPNCNGMPCMARELENGETNLEILASLYHDVTGEDLHERLVDYRFATCYDFTPLSPKALATEIETSLEEVDFRHHAVLDIINNLKDDSVWGQWFPRIAAKKAELFLGQVKDDCKESIFKLMKVNDSAKLSKLAELADLDDIDEILERVRRDLIESRNKEADFNFKLSLGKYVEELIHRELSTLISGQNITVETEQYGCDLSICKNGKPIYFIEVKSRWSADKSVIMSALQLQTSVEEAENYALCYVDMSTFGFPKNNEHHYPELEELIPHIKALPNIGLLNREIAAIVEGKDSRPVYIGGDYKCVVPQKTIQTHGISLASMVEDILTKIRQ